MTNHRRRRQILEQLRDRQLSVPEALELLRGSGRIETSAGESPASSAGNGAAGPVLPILSGRSGDALVEHTVAFLRRIFAEELQVPSDQIDPDSTLEPYGVDSSMVIQLVNRLEKDLGRLPKTLLFEFNSLNKLARHLVDRNRPILERRFGGGETRTATDLESLFEASPKSGSIPADQIAPGAQLSGPGFHRREEAQAVEAIAIIGMAGRFPMARNLDEYWANLASGRHCIREVPADRWDHSRFLGPAEQGLCESRWGGFIDGADQFDPLFFGISPKEAERMDPQERVFLEVAWEAVEDAGYTREGLSEAFRGADGLAASVGVFAGVMYGAYQLLGCETEPDTDGIGPASPYWSVANRVSYVFDFCGPSLTVDTACSASLTAMHLACESLRRGECDAALAGGVTLMVHPRQFLPLAKMKMLSRDDRCRVFGAGADGFVTGEGAGVVLLRPLRQALRAGDRVLGVIRASAINAGGRTSGYTVPNPTAQGELVAKVLQHAGIDPRQVTYLEAHGTGTALGDPIEVAGLTRAFRRFTEEKQFCAIGSVKSNVGHLQAAAGMAGLVKILLQFRHRQLAPTLDADEVNPNIDFPETPFFPVRQLTPWSPGSGANGEPGGVRLRIAGLSSFGVGGANAHLIVEEHLDGREDSGQAELGGGPELIVVSARNGERLREYVRLLKDWLEHSDRSGAVTLRDLAYTLQVGREAMEARVAVVAESRADLALKWTTFLNGQSDPEVLWVEKLAPDHPVVGLLKAVVLDSDYLATMCRNRALNRVAALWLAGFKIPWPMMHAGRTPRRASIPTYPFARKRYWFEGRKRVAPLREATRPPDWEATAPPLPRGDPVTEGNSSVSQPAPASQSTDPPASRAERAAAIRSWLKRTLMNELKLESAEVDPDTAFNDFGVDSLVGTTIAKELGDWLGCKVGATVLWEYPTVRALAEHLAGASEFTSSLAPPQSHPSIPDGGNSPQAGPRMDSPVEPSINADTTLSVTSEPNRAAAARETQAEDPAVATLFDELLGETDGETSAPPAARSDGETKAESGRDRRSGGGDLAETLQRLSETEADSFFDQLLDEQ